MSLQRLRLTAKRLVTKYGKTVTFSQVVTGDYDPTTGDGTNSVTSQEIKAVIDGYSAQDRLNSQIQIDDLKLTIADLDAAPTTADYFTIDGEDFNVIASKRVYAGDAVAVYEVQARAS